MPMVRSHEEMVATARVAGVELDDRYVQLAADAMAVWWDEVVAVRSIDLGGMAHPQPIEPRTAPPMHASHPVPPSASRPERAVGRVGSLARPTELADCTVAELLSLFASRRASPSETLEACLARIEKIDPSVNAVMHVAFDEARAAARESDRRWLSGEQRALDGIPYGVKDNISTADILTTGGSRVLADHVPAQSAFAVERLAAAGAVMIAKLASTEFACGGALNPWYGAVHNPWDLERFAGSSSSGPGGAVAARLVPFALGTDTLGSIRVPAACCGVVGWKPTYGAVSRRGVMPLSWTMDHVGPIARSVQDAALVLDVISAHDHRDESCFGGVRPDMTAALSHSGDLTGLRIGVPRTYYEPLTDSLVLGGMEHVIEVLTERGASVIDIRVDHIEHCFGAGWLVLLCEGASLHEDLWSRPDEYDPGLVFRLLVGKLAPATDYVRALRMRALIQNSFSEAFDAVDAILFPGLVSSAPRYDDLTFDVNGERIPLQKAHARFTAPGNVTGLPALCLPCGLGRDGMPIGVQVYAPAHRDHVCARIGHAFQLDTDHHRQTPTALARLLAS